MKLLAAHKSRHSLLSQQVVHAPRPRRKAKENGELEQPTAFPPRQNTKHSRSLLTAVCFLVATTLFFTIYLLRLDRVIGLMIDDAWYVLLAQSLASGHGYQVVNSPSPGILPLYPPAFPALLSLMFRVAPDFPQNIYLLKSVSIAAMFGLGLLTYFFFKTQRDLPRLTAFGIAFATTMSPPLVVLATSMVMSECSLALSFFATVVAMEKCVQQENGIRRALYALAASALASFSFLTRSMVIGLLVVGVAYLAWKKLYPAACMFASGVACLCLPWLIYSRIHKPTVAQMQEQGGHIVHGYAEQFWDKVAGYPELGEISWSDLPLRVWNNVLEAAGISPGAILTSPLFPGLSQGMGEKWGGIGTVISIVLSLVMVIGFISVFRARRAFAEIAVAFALLTPLIWGFAQFRFIVPFTPFLIYYFVLGLRALHRRYQLMHSVKQVSESHSLTTSALFGILLCSTYSHGDYLMQKLSDSPDRLPRPIRSFNEHEDLLRWAKENLPAKGVIVTQNPPLAYLFTHRKTVNYSFPTERWELWKEMGVRYLVRTSPSPLPADDPTERPFRTLYRTRGEMRLRILDLGDPATRGPWRAGQPEFTTIIKGS